MLVCINQSVNKWIWIQWKQPEAWTLAKQRQGLRDKLIHVMIGPRMISKLELNIKIVEKGDCQGRVRGCGQAEKVTGT